MVRYREEREREKGRTEANRREEGDAARGLIDSFSVDGRPKRLFGRCLAEKAHFSRGEAEVTIFGWATADAMSSAQKSQSSVNRGPKSPFRPKFSRKLPFWPKQSRQGHTFEFFTFYPIAFEFASKNVIVLKKNPLADPASSRPAKRFCSSRKNAFAGRRGRPQLQTPHNGPVKKDIPRICFSIGRLCGV